MKMLSFIKNLLSSSETIGIDLGTTNSVVAVLEDGKPKILETPEGPFTLPSVVAYAKDGSVLVGEMALRQLALNPAKTIFSAKRFIGRDFEAVKKLGTTWTVPFIVRPGYNKEAAFEIDGTIKTPEEIGAEVLKRLKEIAEAYLGKGVTSAVITVPAYFNDRQRQATIDAARIAGLNVEALINEPTAAALAYGQDIEDEQTIGVYDLGGGTYDFSILKIKDNSFEVITTGGNPFLGGDNFDEALMTKVLSRFSAETGFNIAENREAMARVKEAVVKAKIELSRKESATILVPFLMQGPSGPVNLEQSVTRKEFESLIESMIDSTIADMKKALQEAQMKASDLNHILLVGGSTRIPLVKEKIRAFHGQKPLEGEGVDTLVAAGAALHAGILKGEIDAEFIDVTSLSLGLQEIGDVMSVIIEKSSAVPVTKTGTFSTTVDNQEEAELRIFQGESRKASENNLLGEILVTGIEPRPAGVPQILVTYTINADGVLEVKAVDETTGQEQKVILKNSGRLDKKEVRRKQKELSMPENDRKLLNSARAELSREIKRIEEKAEEARDQKAAQALAVRAEEAGRVLEESIDSGELTKTVRDIKRLS
jgi:molecular chaperone DnaK